MEIIEVKGIIINEKAYKESSKIIDIITYEYGIISVIAKGAKRLKSTLRSATDRFSYANFNISYKEEGLSTLISADVINPLKNIKKDIKKVSYINFLSELTHEVYRHFNTNKIYDIFKSAILKVEEGFDPAVITNILEIKYLSFLGVMPKLDGCVVCDNKNVVTLSAYKGGFLCKDHIENEYIVSDKTIKLIRLLEYVDINKISKIDISDDVKKEINLFLDDYYERYTGLFLKSKKFLKSLENL